MEHSQQQRLDGLELFRWKRTLPLLGLRGYLWNRDYQRKRPWARDEYDVFELYDNQRRYLPAKPECSGRGSNDSALGNAPFKKCALWSVPVRIRK